MPTSLMVKCNCYITYPSDSGDSSFRARLCKHLYQTEVNGKNAWAVSIEDFNNAFREHYGTPDKETTPKEDHMVTKNESKSIGIATAVTILAIATATFVSWKYRKQIQSHVVKAKPFNFANPSAL